MTLLEMLETGQLQQALEAAQLRLEHSPQDAEALLTLARLAAAEGRLEAAEELLDRLDPDELPVRLTHLAIAGGRGLHAQAADGYRSLLQDFKDLPEAIYGLASSLAYQGLYEQALPYFQQLTGLVPDQGRFHYHLARNLLELEQPGPALESLTRALELDPRHVDSYLVLSRSLSVLGRRQKAGEVLRLGLQVMPEQPHLLNEWTNLQLLQGQLDGAAQSARRLAQAHPENLAAQANQALAMLAQRRFQEVVDFCAEQPVKSSSLWASQAAALEELEELEAASAAYGKAAECEACDWNVLNNWGLLLLRLGRDEQAEAVLLRARQLDPGRPEPCLNLALLWARHPQGAAQARELLEALLARPGLSPSVQEQARRLGLHLDVNARPAP